MSLEDREVGVKLRADIRLRDQFESVLQSLQMDELRMARLGGRPPRDVTDDEVWQHLVMKSLSDLESCAVPERGSGSVEICTSLTVRSTHELGDLAGRLGFRGQYNYKHLLRLVLLLNIYRRNNGWDGKD